MTKKIVILGAGKSAPYLIRYLYSQRSKLGISLSIISNVEPIYINEFKDISYHNIDINDKIKLVENLNYSYIVVSLLPPQLHFEVAKICSELGINMITASYLDEKIKSLDNTFRNNNSFLFMEMGLDPGIDHMSAMKMINKLRTKSKILEFESYTGGLIKYDEKENPWGYKFTWNPMNVILAGSDNAYYLKDNIEKFIPYKEIFQDFSLIDIPETGEFEGYPNRNSLIYKELYSLDDVRTLKRGTLRYNGYCKAWNALIHLGLTDNSKYVSNLERMSYYDFFNHKIKAKNLDDLKVILKNRFNINYNSREFRNIKWSGFLSDKKIYMKKSKCSEILLHILKDKWTLHKNDIDLIAMYHSFIYEEDNKEKKIISYLKLEGEDSIYTAMAKTVGLPIAILIEHIIISNKKFRGINLPFNRDIYEPVLKKLEKLGVVFKDKEISI